jgi:membrane peptidoglycan carboxypeptidase
MEAGLEKRLYQMKKSGAGSQFSSYGNKLNLNKAKIIKYGAIASFVGLVLLTLTLTAAFAWYAKDLPQPDKIVRRDGFATKIYDRNDKLLYEVYTDEKRIPAELNQIPEELRLATIAIEDKNFYGHEGFDPRGYLRIVYNLIFKRRLIGGSTLTQQIVKNVLLTTERTLSRKLKELVLAIQIERRYSKDEILQIYLNEAPYGGTAWGVIAAAETYFGKPVQDWILSKVQSWQGCLRAQHTTLLTELILMHLRDAQGMYCAGCVRMDILLKRKKNRH